MNAYEILHKYFIPAGFTLAECQWHPKKDGTVSFHATLCSVQEGKISRVNGTSHTDFIVHGDTPDEVVEKIFTIAKTEKLWLGQHGNYHSVIEWHPSAEQFIIRALTKEEGLRQHSVL
ncbi:MAG: hypothetical protein ACOYMZ_02880 [Minisyncoccia bacterium]